MKKSLAVLFVSAFAFAQLAIAGENVTTQTNTVESTQSVKKYKKQRKAKKGHHAKRKAKKQKKAEEQPAPAQAEGAATTPDQPAAGVPAEGGAAPTNP